VVLSTHFSQRVAVSRRNINVQQQENQVGSERPTTSQLTGALAMRRRLQRAALACLAFSAAGIAVSGLAHSSPLNLALEAPLVSSRAVPTYFSDSANWSKVKLQAGGISYAVMNPDSGPGAASDPIWVSRIATIGLTNPSIVGYVDTSYAARPLATVQSDITKYFQWYGVKSIFLDQTPFGCTPETVSYYSAVASAVHARGGIIIMNPGTLPLNCMIDIGDIIVSFENSLPYYLSSTAVNPIGYAPQKFWHLVYGVPVSRHREIEELARSRGAGYVYVTADDLPNPWDTVETFPATPITAPGTVISNDTTTTTTTTTTAVPAPSTAVPLPTRPPRVAVTAIVEPAPPTPTTIVRQGAPAAAVPVSAAPRQAVS
jgi:Spherulation-specific family 4